MPNSRTVSVASSVDGTIRIAHVDHVKPYQQSALRAAEHVPKPPVPQPSVEAQRKAVDMLERQCHMAKHVLGSARARATIEAVLGSSSLPPLPANIQAAIDQQPALSSPPSTPAQSTMSSIPTTSFQSDPPITLSNSTPTLPPLTSRRVKRRIDTAKDQDSELSINIDGVDYVEVPPPSVSSPRIRVVENKEAPWKSRGRNNLTMWNDILIEGDGPRHASGRRKRVSSDLSGSYLY